MLKLLKKRKNRDSKGFQTKKSENKPVIRNLNTNVIVGNNIIQWSSESGNIKTFFS